VRAIRKPLLAGLLIAAAIATAPPAALADVDPASDVLLQQNVFLPYQPQVCDQLKSQLTELTKRTSTAGYPLKVAVIGRQYDLGGAPEFYGKPSAYAKFLGQELAVFGPDVGRDLARIPLLVVMPQGFGTYQIQPEAAGAVRALDAPGDADPNGLARAAAVAVPKVATAAGHPVGAVAPASGCTKKSSGTNFVLFAAPIVVLLIAGIALRFALRGRSAHQGEAE
jgi:hypothetical protein